MFFPVGDKPAKKTTGKIPIMAGKFDCRGGAIVSASFPAAELFATGGARYRAFQAP
jgi:hypothetical protein